MTPGDMAYGQSTLLNEQSLTIRPSTSTVEWMIHNIIIPFGSACELYQSDGSINILIMNVSTSLLSYNFHCSTSSYYIVKNVSGNTIQVGYDGLIMAE